MLKQDRPRARLAPPGREREVLTGLEERRAAGRTPASLLIEDDPMNDRSAVNVDV
jgi:hypothetical protein